MTAAEQARELFSDGYNCAQAVFAAFAPALCIDRATALRLSMGLGGGVGRMREVCGAVSGAAMVFGTFYGGEKSEDKTAVYEKVRAFADRFRALHGSIVCRELLQKRADETESAKADPRTQQYYQSRPCAILVYDAAQIVEEMLQEDGFLG